MAAARGTGHNPGAPGPLLRNMTKPNLSRRWVALLRGVNVGRAKRVPMGEWRDLLVGLGYGDVRTLLNSGNAVFDATSGSAVTHAHHIRSALAGTLGVDVEVVVKSAAELAEIVLGNRLGELADDATRLAVVFMQSPAALAPLRPLALQDWSPEAMHLGAEAAYLWCPRGMIESRVAKAVDRALGPTATVRNWATVGKLNAMVQAGLQASRRPSANAA